MTSAILQRNGQVVQLILGAGSAVLDAGPPGDATLTQAPVAVGGFFDAGQFVQAIASPKLACAQLRRLLARDEALGASVHRMDGHQVRQLVAQGIAMGRIRVLSPSAEAFGAETRRETMHQLVRQRPVAPAADGPAPSARRATPVSAPSAEAADDDVAHVDQDAQAATLKAAAERGVPFCEVCEKAAREAAAREAAALPA